jgi:hypothetical protein
MNNQEQNHTTEEMFCIDDLMSELKTYAKQELQKIGKPHIEAETYPYSESATYWIVADREHLRRIIAVLLDDAVKNIDNGFIVFGYFVPGYVDGIDVFVDDTRITRNREYNDDDFSTARELVEQTGSRLKVEKRNIAGLSFMFAVKGFTKLVKN